MYTAIITLLTAGTFISTKNEPCFSSPSPSFSCSSDLLASAAGGLVKNPLPMGVDNGLAENNDEDCKEELAPNALNKEGSVDVAEPPVETVDEDVCENTPSGPPDNPADRPNLNGAATVVVAISEVTVVDDVEAALNVNPNDGTVAVLVLLADVEAAVEKEKVDDALDGFAASDPKVITEVVLEELAVESFDSVSDFDVGTLAVNIALFTSEPNTDGTALETTAV